MELARQPGATRDNALPRVQSVVAARLALLSEEARAAAEVAAAVGRDFRFDILAQASDLEEDALVRALDELWRRHIVRVQADERWDFSHDRIREVAYSGIGPARRRLIHRRIAQGMELLFANRLDEVSASIADAPRSRRPAGACGAVSRTRGRRRDARVGQRGGDPLSDARAVARSSGCRPDGIATSRSWRCAPACRSR